MRFKILVLNMIILFYSLALIGKEFKIIDKWMHKEIVYGNFLNALVDDNNELIIMLANYGVKIVNKTSLRNFAPKGQGPGDILNWLTLCKYDNGMIADIELYRKIQLFKKEKNKYKWVSSLWREEKNCLQLPHSAIYLDSKWLIGGAVIENNMDAKKGKLSLASPFFVRILNSGGHFIRKLVRRDVKKRMPIYLKTFLGYSRENVYVFIEDEMIAYLISRKDFKTQRSIRLTYPNFYKKIKNETYVITKRSINKKNAKFQYQKWKMSYSSISNIVINKNELIVQIRTANSKFKKFALLFYDLNKMLKLKRIFYINDLLIAYKNNKFYFLENGDPAIDDDAGELNINIYKMVESRK